MPEAQDFKYDVFLSHSSKDKRLVRKLAERLKADGLRVWLDEWEIHPGDPIGIKIEQGLEQSRTLILFMSQNAFGSEWVLLERHTAMFRDPANRQRRFVPLRLDDAEIKDMLKQFAYIDWRIKNRKQYQTLLRGCRCETGEAVPPSELRPVASPPKTKRHDTCKRVRCKLNCQEAIYDHLHMRPATFIARLCLRFPQTEFRIIRQITNEEPVNPKNWLELLSGHFQHGEVVTVEVRGKLQAMAAKFFKLVWENLGGYSDDITETKARLCHLIDGAFERLYDPDLDELEEHIAGVTDALVTPDEEQRFIAIINDRLHYLSLPMLPLIAKHFGSVLQLSFDLPEKGIYSFKMEPENGYELDKRIVDLEIGVGTRITVLTSGPNAAESGGSVRDVLENLWQCDQWLRRRVKDFTNPQTIKELLEFAKEMSTSLSSEYGYVQNPFISNLLTAKNVFVNCSGTSFTKEDVLRQLSAPHARLHELDESTIFDQVQEAEEKLPVVLRPGFVLAHGAMDRTPRISISFGVYPDGVEWSDDEHAAKLVAMVIHAKDTQRTWRDYRKRFAKVFHSNLTLQGQLVAARHTEEFVSLLRKAEINSIKS